MCIRDSTQRVGSLCAPRPRSRSGARASRAPRVRETSPGWRAHRFLSPPSRRAPTIRTSACDASPRRGRDVPAAVIVIVIFFSTRARVHIHDTDTNALQQMLFPCTFLVRSSRHRSSRAVETLVEREGVADEGVGANARALAPGEGWRGRLRNFVLGELFRELFGLVRTDAEHENL